MPVQVGLSSEVDVMGFNVWKPGIPMVSGVIKNTDGGIT